MSSTDHVRVLIVDDSVDFRAGLKDLLSSTCDVVGTLDDGEGIEDAVEQWCPDVILLDISLPTVDGFEAARRVLEVCPESKIIFLTNHIEPDYQHEAQQIGARGLVDKARVTKELIPAIQAVHNNETFYPLKAKATRAGFVL